MKKVEKKDKSLLWGFIVLAVIILIGIIVLCLKSKTPKEEINTKSVIYSIGVLQKELFEDDSVVINSYEEYINLIEEDELSIKESDFDKNDFVLLKVWYDSCSESDINVEDYEISNNVLIVNISYTAKCGVCAPRYMYFMLPVAKGTNYTDTKIDYKANNDPDCDPNVAYKPIIYIYPTSIVDVNVKLGFPNYLLVSYPNYEQSGWDVVAYPTGKLIDKKTNRELYSLYWEASNHNKNVTNEGFIVKGTDTVEFLEEKLSILGLSEREAEEFIIYWLPKLKDNKYNYIRFETLDEINSYMPLEITPKPDTLIRVLMDYKPLDEPIKVNEQKLEKISRKGYTVIEWGGSLIG